MFIRFINLSVHMVLLHKSQSLCNWTHNISKRFVYPGKTWCLITLQCPESSPGPLGFSRKDLRSNSLRQTEGSALLKRSGFQFPGGDLRIRFLGFWEIYLPGITPPTHLGMLDFKRSDLKSTQGWNPEGLVQSSVGTTWWTGWETQLMSVMIRAVQLKMKRRLMTN